MNLIDFFLKKGQKPALVSRGYRGNWEKPGGVLSDGINLLGNWRDSGDEAFMVSQNFPKAGVIIGKDRIVSCQKAENLGFKVAILDDGFQYRRLARDIDILMYDPFEKIALRESVSALKRCDIILMKRSVRPKIQKKIQARFPQAKCYNYSVQSKDFYSLNNHHYVPVEALKGRKALIFCGIARPERFISKLSSEGIIPVKHITFRDHHFYPESSLKQILKTHISLKTEIMITTEKDATKLTQRNNLDKYPIYYFKIDLEVDQKFYDHILEKLNRMQPKS